jgi:hypothetical protein
MTREAKRQETERESGMTARQWNGQHNRFKDITNQIFGRLTALHHLTGTQRWMCICACGRHIQVYGFNLRSGCTKSCGCLRRKGQQ